MGVVANSQRLAIEMLHRRDLDILFEIVVVLCDEKSKIRFVSGSLLIYPFCVVWYYAMSPTDVSATETETLLARAARQPRTSLRTRRNLEMKATLLSASTSRANAANRILFALLAQALDSSSVIAV